MVTTAATATLPAPWRKLSGTNSSPPSLTNSSGPNRSVHWAHWGKLGKYAEVTTPKNWDMEVTTMIPAKWSPSELPLGKYTSDKNATTFFKWQYTLHHVLEEYPPCWIRFQFSSAEPFSRIRKSFSSRKHRSKIQFSRKCSPVSYVLCFANVF